MMSGLASRIGAGRGGDGADGMGSLGGYGSFGSSGVVRFAVKMIGIGLCAGLGLCGCQFLIDAFFHTIR